jgi:glucokinase
MLLAGDIGGTKTVLALYEDDSNPGSPAAEQTFPSARYDGLEQIVEQFLRSRRSKGVNRASFGVAGPVVRGRATLPNLPWVIDRERLKEKFSFQAAELINDLEAIGHAVPVLREEDLETVKKGAAAPQGNIAVIAPGTGLGETFLNWNGKRYSVHPSEAGHGDFAPVNDRQVGLLQYLLERFDHVSYERVCSGTGLPFIYAYLKDTAAAEEPVWLAEELRGAEDANAVIIGAALENKRECRICRQTVEMFVSILAAEAGNMVLRHIATGGVYLGGGIPPRILPFLRQEMFGKWFVRKGRLSELPERVPVRTILNPKVALVGAASFGLNPNR